jgi:hypothetical protein
MINVENQLEKLDSFVQPDLLLTELSVLMSYLIGVIWFDIPSCFTQHYVIVVYVLQCLIYLCVKFIKLGSVDETLFIYNVSSASVV